MPNQMVRASSPTQLTPSPSLSRYGEPLFIALIQELNRVAFDHKHALLICDTSNDIQKESDYLDYCAAIRVKGHYFDRGLRV